MIRSVKKVFKKVVSNPIGQLVIGAAASFLTAGLANAIGLTAGLQGALGPTLGLVLSRGLAGAAAGALTTALGGGNVGQGVALGGLGGLIVGGVEAYNLPPGEVARGVAAPVNEPINAPRQAGAVNSDIPVIVNDQPSGVVPASYVKAGVTAAQLPTAGPAVQQSFTSGSPAPKGLLNSFLPSDPEVRGRILGGAAEGALSGVFADDGAAAAEASRFRTEAELANLSNIGASHSNVSQGLLQAGPQPTAPAGAQSPAERFISWVYNPQTRRIEPVPA